MSITDFDVRRATMQSTIEDVATMLSEDGAALTVVALDPVAAAVELSLELIGIECEECLLPPAQLRATIAAALERGTGAPVSVVVRDPRDAPAAAAPALRSSRSFVVLDPVGVVPDSGVADPGPGAGPLAGKTVAIRRDVLWPAFDWTVEEWTRSLEEAGVNVMTWARAQGLKDDDLRRADAEYEALLATADVAIAGLANCGSCTSWSVRDAVLAASKGMPTAVVATAHFEPLAQLLAAEAGRPGLRVVVLPYPYSTLDEDVVRSHARRAFTRLLGVLGATV